MRICVLACCCATALACAARPLAVSSSPRAANVGEAAAVHVVSLRELIELSPVTETGEVLEDVLLGSKGRVTGLVVRRADGGWDRRPWSELDLAGEGVALISRGAAVEASSRREDEPIPPISSGDPVVRVLEGSVRAVLHRRADDGVEYRYWRLQVDAGDLVRVWLGPVGWHARRLPLPGVGARVRVQATETRDERGLLVVARTVQHGTAPVVQLRGAAGEALWPELVSGAGERSALGLLGRRLVVEGGEAVGRVEDLELALKKSGPPALIVRRAAEGGTAIPLRWAEVSLTEDGEVAVPLSTWASVLEVSQ